MAIRHLVLMRLQPGVFTEEARQDYADTFAALKAALPEDVLDAKVYENVVNLGRAVHIWRSTAY